MAKKFSELRARMSPEAQERANVKTQKMLAEMQPGETRHARDEPAPNVPRNVPKEPKP